MMSYIRTLFSDKEFCPFYFQYDFARVMSGEEEAVFAWTASNFLFKSLLPVRLMCEACKPTLDLCLLIFIMFGKHLQVSRSQHEPMHETFGTVDLGGASTQISFFVPNQVIYALPNRWSHYTRATAGHLRLCEQDISEGLFKLQIGSQRHWNLYAKSFLKYGEDSCVEVLCFHDFYFNLLCRLLPGHNSARERHLQTFIETVQRSNGQGHGAEDPCFFSGYEELVEVPEFQPHNQTVASAASVSVRGPEAPHAKQFSQCMESLKPLMQKNLNSFCNTIYDGECSMDGFYQPRLPGGPNGHFIGSAMFKYPWYFLSMPDTATIGEFKQRAQGLCSMSYREVRDYNISLKTTVRKDEDVKYYCFLSSYIAVLLECKSTIGLECYSDANSPSNGCVIYLCQMGMVFRRSRHSQ